MKKLIFTLLAIIFASVCVQARVFVLAVGVSNYNSSANLSQTTKDAKAFKKLMETQTKDITILTSKYANHDNIKEKLRAICNRAQKDDVIIFFYSGHGSPGGMYTYDGLLKYSDLANILDGSAAKMKLCYIDACHSGSAADARDASDWVKGASKDKNDQVYLVGCRSDEYSFENQATGAGYFTKALLKGLRGKSDANGDKKVTVIELFEYVFNDVVQRSDGQQHPQLITPDKFKNAVVMTWD